jgi:putative nucleotidyltransferase with HDIG domain
VEEDPALAAGLLRVANSAFFAHAKAASSVQQAIVRLGQTQVKEIVYSVATMGMFKDVGGYGKSVRDHCASTGALVQYIARDVAPAHEDGLFLCGLLHDIGKLMLINSGEIDYPADNIETVLTPDSVHVFEREELGYDHAVLAGHIIAAWNMEEKISKVVAWHHQPSRAYKDEEIGPMVALLRIADKLDFEMSREDENFEEFLKNLENSSDCQYLQLKEGWLMKHWEDMYKLRLESLSMF